MTVVLKNRIPMVIAELKPRVDAALKVAVEGIAEESRGRVPVDHGDLRDAIHTQKGGGGYYVIAGDDDVFYGHMVEHGTSHSPPRPFLVPAFEAGRHGVVEGVMGVLARL